MRTTKARSGAFCALLFVLGATLTACGGGGTTITPGPTPAPTVSSLPASAYTTASCSTAGTTSASIAGGNLVGLGTITTPAVGGCSYSNNLGIVVTGASAGTYAGTISLAAPAGLPSIPAANTCSGNCANNGPPPGFSTTNFVPLFYVTLQLSGFVGNLSSDNPSITMMVNSITSSSNSQNFFIGSWSSNIPGSTAPPITTTAFTGWSNNNSTTALANVPLTVTPPNTLSLPSYPCGALSGCGLNPYTAPQSFTLVQVVGYFT